jgi:transcriptional antiterminator RfaH
MLLFLSGVGQSLERMSFWAVVVTKPRSEKTAAENLARQNFVFYLPLLRQTRLVRGKKSTELVPLFPRYMFVLVENDRWFCLQGTRGVQHILTIDNRPQRVPQKVIDQLQANEEEVLDVHSLWAPGEQVRVVDGAFAGMLGIYDSSTKADRERVFVSILGRLTCVEVPTSGLESAPPAVR